MSSTATAAPAEQVQPNNFNPSWMRSAYHGLGVGSSPRVSTNDEEEHSLSAPVFVKNRYGREDLLALCSNPRAPDGLSECPFFVSEPSQPIVCYPLSEVEQRLQQNINSSKAMSSLTNAERKSVAEGAAFSPNAPGGVASRGGGTAGGWTPVKSSNWKSTQASPSPVNGRGGRGGYVARGLATRSLDQREPQTDGFQPAYGARYSAARGRGTTPTARGGSSSATTFNPRAQGLYDPRDPKDRPRTRVRSTSDEGEHTENGLNPVKANNIWKENEPSNTKPWTREAAWASNRGDSITHSGPWKSESSGTMPEWMDDCDKERTSSEEAVGSGTGSFDEQGRYRQTTSGGSPPVTERQQSIPEANPWNEKKLENQHAQQQFARMTSREEVRAYSQPKQDVSAYMVHQMAPPVPVVKSPPKFCYLDPNEHEQGPFEKIQMDAWFSSGYFKDTLNVKRTDENVYRSLGELKRMNGNLTPFDFPDRTAPVVQPPPTNYQSFGHIFGNGAAMWNEQNMGLPMNTNYAAPAMDMSMEKKRLEELQMRQIEEQLKQKEKEMMEALKRQAEEQGKLMLEKEFAMKRKEEELARRIEEERTRREIEQLELAEKIKQLELEKQARIQAEKRAAEESKKADEARKDILRKQQEEEARRVEEEDRKRRAEEAAEIHRKHLAQKAEEDAAKIRKQQQLQQQARKEESERQTAAAAAAAAASASAAAMSRQNSEKFNNDGWEVPSSDSEWNCAPVRSPRGSDEWVTPSNNKKAPKAAPWLNVETAAPREKTLKEIQEEEERQLRAEREQQAKIRREQEAANIQSSGTWSNITQKINWNQPAPIARQVSASGKAWGTPDNTQTSSLSSWDGPTLQAANRTAAPAPAPAKKAPVAKPTPVAKSPAKSNAKSNAKGDPFNTWVVNRLQQLNNSVEADVLANFLITVENPNEIEDYVEGYLGATKASKEFVKEFLQKRCELRNRKSAKDDLSSASVAPATGTVSTGGKKKKGKGTRLVVDGSCLGFRPAADSNRINQGTIDLAPPPPGTKR